MRRTNNFSKKTPRQNTAPLTGGKLFRGSFQSQLEPALAGEIAAHKQRHGPLAPLRVVVPTRLLALHLQRALARRLPTGHCNLRIVTLTDFAASLAGRQSLRIAPRLGLELLCQRIVREIIPRDGYFSPVRDTKGFRAALLETFKDLRQGGITPAAFTAAAQSKKHVELAKAYEEFCDWLPKNAWRDEPDVFVTAAGNCRPQENDVTFLYGFYDLTTVQRRFISAVAPAAVFFPEAEPGSEFSAPLLAWFQSQGYPLQNPEPKPVTPAATVVETIVISAPGETAEVREAAREALVFVQTTGRTFNDVAILCRSLEQYGAVLRDTLAGLGIRTYFRGGRPLAELRDAKLFLLVVEAVRSNLSRSAVMELAGHVGPRSHWDALSVKLGVVGGKAQWLARVRAATKARSADDETAGRLSERETATELLRFIETLFDLTDRVPTRGTWAETATACLSVFQSLGGNHPRVIEEITALAELDGFESPVSFDVFSEFCREALENAAEQTERFQDGGVFVGDVMAARGITWPLVLLLGMVEKSFPRLVREDPLLLDDERVQLNEALKKSGGELPVKRRGEAEEKLLFALTRQAAAQRFVLSYPRLETTSARPRVPSFLLLDHTAAPNFKELEKRVRTVPLAPVNERADPLDEREIDLAALQNLSGRRARNASLYLAEISRVLPAGLAAERQRWGENALTRHDGLFVTAGVKRILRERFGLDNLVIGATSLEDCAGCPFYYFQKHVLRVERWEEPEQAISIDPLDLGTLYHRILDNFFTALAAGKKLPFNPSQPADYQQQLRETAQREFARFEREGITGFPCVWEVSKEIVREELAAFLDRELGRADEGLVPAKFEEKFAGVDFPIAGARAIRLRGMIDRLDLSADGKRARVFDYKTGKVPRRLGDDELAGGEALQLPLYIIAAETALAPGARVDAASYVYLTLRGRYRELNFTRAALEERREDLQRVMGDLADLIENGVFAQYATADNCRHCEYRPICGNGILKLYERKAGDKRTAEFRAMKAEVS